MPLLISGIDNGPSVNRKNGKSLSGVHVTTFGTNHVDDAKIEAAVRDVFDLRPGAIVRDLDLKKPVYQRSAAYGHFGRSGFTWEDTNRLDDFKAAVGV